VTFYGYAGAASLDPDSTLQEERLRDAGRQVVRAQGRAGRAATTG
jgi:hypothetical protein